MQVQSILNRQARQTQGSDLIINSSFSIWWLWLWLWFSHINFRQSFSYHPCSRGSITCTPKDCSSPIALNLSKTHMPIKKTHTTNNKNKLDLSNYLHFWCIEFFCVLNEGHFHYQLTEIQWDFSLKVDTIFKCFSYEQTKSQ